METIKSGLLQRCRLAMNFGLQCQKAKSMFHYLTLGSFYTSFRTEGKEQMKTTEAIYIVELTAKGMIRAVLSIKVSPYRI